MGADGRQLLAGVGRREGDRDEAAGQAGLEAREGILEDEGRRRVAVAEGAGLQEDFRVRLALRDVLAGDRAGEEVADAEELEGQREVLLVRRGADYARDTEVVERAAELAEIGRASCRERV